MGYFFGFFGLFFGLIFFFFLVNFLGFFWLFFGLFFGIVFWVNFWIDCIFTCDASFVKLNLHVFTRESMRDVKLPLSDFVIKRLDKMNFACLVVYRQVRARQFRCEPELDTFRADHTV